MLPTWSYAGATIRLIRQRCAAAARWASWALAAVLPLSLALGNVFSAIVLAGAAPALRRDALRGLRWPLIGLALWVGAAMLATLLSPQPRWDKMIEEFWLKGLVIAIPLFATRASTLRAFDIFLVFGVAVAAFAATQHFHGLDPWRGGTVNRFGERYQAVGFFGHHLSYGGHLVVLICALLARWLRTRRWRIFVGASLLITLLALQWSVARSAQLGLVAALCALALGGGRRLRWTVAGALAVTLIASLATPGLRAHWANALDQDEESTRVLLWRSSLDGIGARPWGYGPGNFGLLMHEHARAGNYESRSHTHSDPLMVGVNAGVLGVLGYGLFWGGCGVVLWRRSRRGGEAALAAFACIVAFAVAGLFQVYQTDDEVELALYFLLGHGLAERPEAGST